MSHHIPKLSNMYTLADLMQISNIVVNNHYLVEQQKLVTFTINEWYSIHSYISHTFNQYSLNSSYNDVHRHAARW